MTCVASGFSRKAVAVDEPRIASRSLPAKAGSHIRRATFAAPHSPRASHHDSGQVELHQHRDQNTNGSFVELLSSRSDDVLDRQRRPIGQRRDDRPHRQRKPVSMTATVPLPGSGIHALCDWLRRRQLQPDEEAGAGRRQGVCGRAPGQAERWACFRRRLHADGEVQRRLRGSLSATALQAPSTARPTCLSGAQSAAAPCRRRGLTAPASSTGCRPRPPAAAG
jgi:hypothetical protein